MTTITYTFMATLEAVTEVSTSGVPTFNPITLFTCNPCGALVRGDTQATHTKWHIETRKVGTQ